jgi:hypothetical protein
VQGEFQLLVFGLQRRLCAAGVFQQTLLPGHLLLRS